LFLNHDTVLIAEIITALTEAPGWGWAIESRNCFRLPKKGEPIPPVLRYAAAATVLLASAKVQDHASDSGKLCWRVLARWLNPLYRHASAELRHWGVPVRDIERQLATQQQREARRDSLESLAEPTAFATAQIFRHAAPVAARSELGPMLARFGRRFGYLIYLLDAWEDFEKDAARGDFNAFRALYGNRGSARADVAAAAQAVTSSFQELPVPDDFRNQLLLRFRANLMARFSATLPVISPPMLGHSGFTFAGVRITMAPVSPGKRPAGGFLGGIRTTCCRGCGDSCCEGCGDSCCEGYCSSCDC
jgi:hypothetical protein